MACLYGQKLSRSPRKHFDKFTSEISVTEIIFISYEHNFPALHFTKSTSKRKTLPAKRENISPYEQNNIIWPAEMFFRQPR